MEIKKLSWLHREQYDSLPVDYRDLKRKFNDSHTELKRKNKRFLKIKDEINQLKNELRVLSRQHNKLYNKLEFINKSYTPKSYLQSYSKNGKGEYLQIIVKYLNTSKTIYLGTKSKILIKLDPYIENLNGNNYKFKIGNFLSPIILKSFINLKNPTEFLSKTYTMGNIMEVLDNKNDS